MNLKFSSIRKNQNCLENKFICMMYDCIYVYTAMSQCDDLCPKGQLIVGKHQKNKVFTIMNKHAFAVRNHFECNVWPEFQCQISVALQFLRELRSFIVFKNIPYESMDLTRILYCHGMFKDQLLYFGEWHMLHSTQKENP